VGDGVSRGDEFEAGDEVRVIRGKHIGEIGVVLDRLKTHYEYVYVQFDDEDDSDDLHAFLDAELEALSCQDTSASLDSDTAVKQHLPRLFFHKGATRSEP
jgi:hypothetical protein